MCTSIPNILNFLFCSPNLQAAIRGLWNDHFGEDPLAAFLAHRANDPIIVARDQLHEEKYGSKQTE